MMILCIVSIFLLVGCSSEQENTFHNQLKEMYTISVRQVMDFKKIDQSSMKEEEKVRELVRICKDYIQEIEAFQNIEVPNRGEGIYQSVNDVSMDLSDTLVLITHSLGQGNKEQYTQYKDDLAFLFMEAGYLGEELGEYLGEENFVEDLMGQYQ